MALIGRFYPTESGGSVYSQAIDSVNPMKNFPHNTRVLRARAIAMWPAMMLVMLLIAGSVGCSTLPSSLSDGGMLSSGSDSSVPPNAGGPPQYLVDMQMSYGGSKKYRGTIDGSSTVQTALKASGATKKFRKMDILVMRKVEGEYLPLKMASQYDTSTRSVSPETDYALQHGDRIVVSAVSENSLFKLLGKVGEAK